ncbi:hypothetical protein HRbin12_01891 [bacterium HR12]|nr:hypothetical protein HRbin12_01891 [bacterium HR12]
MTRTSVRPSRRAAAIALLAGCLALGLARTVEGAPRQEERGTEARAYVVRAGDTLWSIAREIAPGADPRPIVDAIARANDVAPGALVPGQVLLVPLEV